MLIATFGPTTAWVGKQITHDGDAFVLEGHGPLSAADIMEYDRQGHLVWVNDGARAWVGSKAAGPAASRATAAARTPRTRERREKPAGGAAGQAAPPARTRLKRALLYAIVALVITNVVLLLALFGAFRGL